LDIDTNTSRGDENSITDKHGLSEVSYYAILTALYPLPDSRQHSKKTVFQSPISRRNGEGQITSGPLDQDNDHVYHRCNLWGGGGGGQYFFNLGIFHLITELNYDK
jgi:hypothetical protein